jgi:hypothetical protein
MKISRKFASGDRMATVHVRYQVSTLIPGLKIPVSPKML